MAVYAATNEGPRQTRTPKRSGHGEVGRKGRRRRRAQHFSSSFFDAATPATGIEVETADVLHSKMIPDKAEYNNQPMGKDEEKKEMPSFTSSSLFAAAIIATAIEAASADDTEAPVKNGSKEETTDGAPGADGLFDAWRTE